MTDERLADELDQPLEDIRGGRSAGRMSDRMAILGGNDSARNSGRHTAIETVAIATLVPHPDNPRLYNTDGCQHTETCRRVG
jgi:hypothetical protein